MNLVALLLPLLLTTSPVPSGERAGEGADQLTITAERVLYDGQAGRTTAEGHAVLVGEDVALSADRLVYDRERSAITASGHVVARIAQGGLLAVTADVVTLRLEGNEVKELFLLDGTAVSKVDTTKEALLAADTADALERTGRTNALLQGNHLARDGATWNVDRIELVPCECNFKEPSWSITASSASLDTEAERVSVVSPVVRVKQVPVLWLPWLSLPTTGRQTGILFPRPNYQQLNGFSLEQPVFITLGRSADLTLTPGFFTGGSGAYGIAGPRLLGELRYVPSHRAQGRLTLGVLYDARLERDPVTATLTGTSPRGVRGEGSWQHLQDFDRGFGLRVDARLYSDGNYNRDVTPDVVASTTGYLRSTALALQRGDDHLVSLDVTLRQDLAYGYSWAGTAPPSVPGGTAPTYGPNPLQRLPALTFTLPARRLAGPLAIDVQAEAVRLAPLFGLSGDEGPAANEGRLDENGTELSFQCLRERLYYPTPVSGACGVTDADKAGQGDRVYQAGEREARDRLSLLPRLSVAGAPGGVISLSAFAGYRQSLWVGEVTGRTWQRGYPLLGARAETELGRTFAAGALRHGLVPVVEVRAVPVVVRGSNNADLEPAPYDDVDRSVPVTQAGLPTARVQGLAELRQRVSRADGSAVFRFDVGQGVELAAPGLMAPGLAETYARTTLTIGWVNLGAAARADFVTPRLTRLSATGAVDDGKGHAVYAAYDNLLDDGTNRTRAPIDLLFGPLVPATVTARSNLLTAGARWHFSTVGLRYEALLLDRLWSGTVERFSLAQHTVGVSWAPACDCWKLEVFATQRPRSDGTWAFPDVGATLTVSRLGSIGVGR